MSVLIIFRLRYLQRILLSMHGRGDRLRRSL